MSDQNLPNKSGVKTIHKYKLTVLHFHRNYFRKFRRKSEINKQSSAEIQTPFHRDLIGCCMTAPPPVLSPSNILPPSLLTTLSIPQEEIAMGA
jgi:hypothetical protein